MEIQWKAYPKYEPPKVNTKYLVTYQLLPFKGEYGVEIRTWRGVNYDHASGQATTLRGFCFWDTPSEEYFPNDKNVIAWAELPEPYTGGDA